NCTFIENKVKHPMGREGGVFYNRGETLTIQSCIFMNNTATGNGSIVSNHYGSVTIENSVLICQNSNSALYNVDEYGKTITAN
ncbi:MAG: hypothetical protein BZ137_09765, partial [Methanosphaera sp. rholeuAM130]